VTPQCLKWSAVSFYYGDCWNEMYLAAPYLFHLLCI